MAGVALFLAMALTGATRGLRGATLAGWVAFGFRSSVRCWFVGAHARLTRWIRQEIGVAGACGPSSARAEPVDMGTT